MENNNEDKKYDVGYGKTPVHTRFKPGQSGNPKGRKKGTVDISGILMRELNKKMRVREGDQDIIITKQEALVKGFVNSGIRGKAAVDRRDVFDMISRLYGFDSPFEMITADQITRSFDIHEQFRGPYPEDPAEDSEK